MAKSGNDLPPISDGHRTALRAVRWTLAGSLVQRLVTFFAVAFLARQLTEIEYGVYRQLLSVHLVLYVILPLGFDQLYIRETKHRKRFTLLLAGAVTFTASVIAVLGLIAHGLVVQWMDFSPWGALLWFAPAIVALQAGKYLYKNELAGRLAYREISIGETIYATASGGVAVALAIKWPFAWSLYIAYALAEVAELIYTRHVSRVRFPPIRLALAALWRYGARWKRFCLFHCGNVTFNAIGGNAPTIILGASFSKAWAGAYSMANWLITVPIYLLMGALHRVAFTALAGRNRQQLISPVLQMLRLSAVFIVPVLIWVVVMAEPIVTIVLGEKWVNTTAPIARAISLYCIFQALFSPVSSIDVLLDRPDYGFYWTIVATAVRVTAVVAGLHWGVMHAVIAYAIVSAVLWIIWGCMLANLLGAGQWVFHRAWLRTVPFWMTLALLLSAGNMITTNPWLQIFLSTFPAIVYTSLIALLDKPTFNQGFRLLKR